jgi:hypothetical protein
LMTAYEHTIAVVHRDDILRRAESEEIAPSVVYCDTEGVCFFDEAPNPYMKAIVELLDDMGAEGWVLVQVIPRAQDLICFWRREVASSEQVA